jgi:hypothetical protein
MQLLKVDVILERKGNSKKLNAVWAGEDRLANVFHDPPFALP